MADPSKAAGPSASFDVTGARAVVECSMTDGQTCILSSIESESVEAGQVTFDCHFRPLSSTAFFRLRASTLLKGSGRKITPLFLHIAPERIESLEFEDSTMTRLPDDVKMIGDGDVVSLRFKLKHAGDLVVPPQSSLVPKKKIYRDVFDSLLVLSQELDFVVYLRQGDLPSQGCLASFCEAVTTGRLACSAAHADISRLYDGQGGRVLEGEDLSIPAAASLDSPPSYEHAGPPPPAPPIGKEKPDSVVQDNAASSSRKRRRTSSSPAHSAMDGVTNALALDNDRVETICRKLMGEMSAKWREDSDQLRSELQQMETRVKDWVDERLSKHVDELRRELREASVERRNYVDDEFHEVKREVQETYDRVEEVHEDLQELRNQSSDVVDDKVEERMEAMRGELQEFVTDKMYEAQDRVLDHIRSNVYIDFNIYD